MEPWTSLQSPSATPHASREVFKRQSGRAAADPSGEIEHQRCRHHSALPSTAYQMRIASRQQSKIEWLHEAFGAPEVVPFRDKQDARRSRRLKVRQDNYWWCWCAGSPLPTRKIKKCEQNLISPGIEPGTFSVLTKCDNRYTTKP